MKSDNRMTRATSAAHQLARRYRWLIAISLVWLWWALAPPTDAAELAIGLTVALVIHRTLAPARGEPTGQDGKGHHHQWPRHRRESGDHTPDAPDDRTSGGRSRV